MIGDLGWMMNTKTNKQSTFTNNQSGINQQSSINNNQS